MHPHQQSGFICFDAFLQSLLDVNGTAYSILSSSKGQFHLQQSVCMHVTSKLRDAYMLAAGPCSVFLYC